MVSRKTQLAWMAAGGVLCLFTVLISCKMREENRATASDDGPPLAIVPLPSPEKPAELKPLPDGDTPLPPIGQAEWIPTRPVATPVPISTIELPQVVPSIEIRPGSAVKPVVFQEPTPPAPSIPTVPPVVMPPTPPPAPAATVDVKPPAVNPPTVPPGDPLVAPPPVVLTPPIPPVKNPKPSDPVSAPPTVSSVREPGEPPLAPQPGPVVFYHVRQGGEVLQDISRRTLGTAERWVELVRLNPSLPHDNRLTAGTLVRLPADACVPTEELEVVKPLPGLKPAKMETSKPKVVLPLTGTFPCNLDDQHALLLPKSIRDQLGSTETMMLSPGTDQCLWLTTPTHLERLAQRMEQSQAKEVDVHTFKRLYFAQTEKVSLTAEGRVVISDRLAQFAGLHQEVVLVGIDDHFELWDVARWKDFTQKKSAAARANIVAEQE